MPEKNLYYLPTTGKPETCPERITENGQTAVAGPHRASTRLLPDFVVVFRPETAETSPTDRLAPGAAPNRLLRGFLVKIVSDERVDEIRNPDRNVRGQQTALGEFLGKLTEQNERESQHDADTDVQPRSSRTFRDESDTPMIVRMNVETG